MKNKFKFKKILPWIWFAVGYILNIFYQFIFGKLMLDSDMSAEMILANLLNSEGSILSNNWFYSTELRVFQMQWFYRLGLILFPNNWHLARSFSMLLAIVIFACIAYFTLKYAGLKEYAPWGCAIAVFPIGSWYLWQTLYGGYYLTYILLGFLSLLFIVKYSESLYRKNKIVYFVLSCLVGLISGLNGVKQIMVFWIPVCIAAVWISCYSLHNSNDRKITLFGLNHNNPYLLISLSSTCSSLIGYLVNSHVLSGIYSFQSYENIKIADIKNPITQITSFIKSFGFSQDLQLISPRGIASVLGLLIGILILFSAFRLLKHYSHMSANEQFLFFLCFSMIFFCIFVFWILDSEIQYYQSVIPFGLILLILEIKNEDITISSIRIFLLNALMCIVFIVSLGTIKSEITEPLHPKKYAPDINSPIEWLKSNDYTKGVSRFWLSPLITELSDGTIEMWTLTEEEDSWYEWLQKKDHMTKEPDNKYFYIYFQGFASPYLEAHPELKLVYADSLYKIFATE